LRLKEAAKLGFTRAVVPKGYGGPSFGMQLTPVTKLLEALIVALPGAVDAADD
jgi:DNA repair protein RadA/Sms